jgi:hypothetical protein
MHHRAVTARAFAEHAALARAAAMKFFFHERHRFLQQEIGPRPHRRAVDILIAAQLGEAIGKRHDARRHRTASDQTVQPLRHVLGKVLPIGVRRAAGGETHKIDQQRQAVGLTSRGNIDVDDARARIAQQIALEHIALERQPMHLALGEGRFAFHLYLSLFLNLSGVGGVPLTHIFPISSSVCCIPSPPLGAREMMRCISLSPLPLRGRGQREGGSPSAPLTPHASHVRASRAFRCRATATISRARGRVIGIEPVALLRREQRGFDQFEIDGRKRDRLETHHLAVAAFHRFGSDTTIRFSMRMPYSPAL